jgi:hypothetical protein
MNQGRFFSGRVIFDHRPKTAGQAVNGWLAEQLGSGSVSSNLVGDHRALIRQYGGLFPVVSGHMRFEGENLDPRYQYITLLREPLDRALSWLSYLQHDVGTVRETVAMIEGAKRFLASDGFDTTPEFLASISNPYVQHFGHVKPWTGNLTSEEKLAAALDVIKEYDVVGLYDQMPHFLVECADLLCLTVPDSIPRVNSSSKRLASEHVSPALVARIKELNSLDLAFYAAVTNWKRDQWESEPAKDIRTCSRWEKFDPQSDERCVTTSALNVHGVEICEGDTVLHGHPITFEVDFTLNEPVIELEMGIHILDEDRRWAFGTNTTLLKMAQTNLGSGRYRAAYLLLAKLPAGAYTAGFAFGAKGGDEDTELAWHNRLCEFRVLKHENDVSVGYSHLPAAITLREIPI